MAKEEEPRKRKGPSPNIGLQQRIPVKQLVYTPPCVIATLVAFGVLFLIVGIICVVIEGTVTSFPGSGPYKYFEKGETDSCPCAPTDNCPGQGTGFVKPCLVTFNLTEDMPGPVFFYYTLTNFHQNYQRYVKSKSVNQLRKSVDLAQIAQEEGSFDFCSIGNAEKYQAKNLAGQDASIYYYPCGLLARSLFNDTFRLLDGNKENVEWTDRGIEYSSMSGDSGRHRAHDVDWHKENCYALGGASFDTSGFDESLRKFALDGGYKNGRFDCWHNISDPALLVWSRPAARSDFWKLHRRIEGGLKKGSYSIEIGINFPVANFSGTKGFYFTNATPMGGSRPLLSGLYLAVGSTLVAAAIAFAAVHVARPGGLRRPVVKYPPTTIAVPKGGATGAARLTLVQRLLHAFKGLPLFQAGAPRLKGRTASEMPAGADAPRRECAFPKDGAVKFETNFVKTSRYTVFTFLPLNLFIQFQRLANFYFLVVATLAFTPYSPMNGVTYLGPLFLVLAITALTDAVEDYARHKSDAEENARKTWVFDTASGNFAIVPWRDVEVGDVVMVTTSDDDSSPMIPADLVLLCSSSTDGTAFLETMNLDGETNLKVRESLEATHKALTRPCKDSDGNEAAEIVLREIARFEATAVCNEPDSLLYEFSAKLKYTGHDLPLNGGASGGQFLQRSAKLRNTRFVVGLAVYTGKETKIQSNMMDPPVKVSNIERRVNTYIIGVFVLFMVLCTVSATANSENMKWNRFAEAWYLAPDQPEGTFQPYKSGPVWVTTFVSVAVLLSLLVPISFYVSIEMVKLIIQVMITADREIYAVDDDQKSLARTRGLCEELGQVNYIFSDKTGTLTQNLMEFKKCSIAGVEYGRGFCEVERAIARRQGRSLPDDPRPPPGLDPGFNFVDERLLFGQWQSAPDASIIEDFLVNMAVNHNVQVEYDKLGKHKYEAESPDEGAFVQAARNMGFFFSRREIKDVLVTVSQPGAGVGEGRVRKYKIKQFNPFDNNRKRTSLVVQTEEGAIVLLVKGADTSVMPFIDDAACPFFATTQQHIDRFGEQGLRTLVFAGRRLDPAWYEHWNELYEKAALLPDGREAALRQLAAHIEEDHSKDGCESVIFDASTPHTKSLRLHGVSALEDRLQENVGNCISQLAKAMIKIWVLTGDKLETAINIGFATALLDTRMQMLRMSSDEMLRPQDGTGDGPKDSSEIRKLSEILAAAEARDLNILRAAAASGKRMDKIRGICELVERKTADMGSAATADLSEMGILESRVREALIKERVHSKIVQCVKETETERAGGYALVIDGPCLRVAVSEECKLEFLTMAVRCKAVVCCRVTPAQKAAVTLLVKDNMPGQITLAIGDGANDVSMIQAAHLGIGIRGKEGQQAVLASDYALPRFAYLERLLLVHGRWGYNRIGTFVCYFFYKNIIFALTLFWFCCWNGFSSQPLYDEGYQSCYNVFFTAFPVMVFAVLDRDVEPHVVRAHPELYSVGQTNSRFTGIRFATFIFGAFVHSLLLFYLTIELLDLNVTNNNGQQGDFWMAGTSILGNLIIVVTVIMAIHTRSWHFAHVFVDVGSVAFWFLFLVVYHSMVPGYFILGNSYDEDDNVYNLIFELGSTLLHHLTTLLIVVMCCAPVMCYMMVREHYFPKIDDYYRRVCYQPDLYPNETMIGNQESSPQETSHAVRVDVSTPPGNGVTYNTAPSTTTTDDGYGPPDVEVGPRNGAAERNQPIQSVNN